MKYLKLFEDYEDLDHLKVRGVVPEKTRFIYDEQSGDTYFFLYNLSGQMTGYQKYNPAYPKTGQGKLEDPRLAKYFIWTGDEGYGKKIAVWGLESLKWNDEYLFVTEGIFDCVKIHNSGNPAIAVMCNNPSDSLKSWIRTLPQKKIVIYDNDVAGRRLKTIGDWSFTTPESEDTERVIKDLGDMTQEEANEFISEIKEYIKNEAS